MSDDWLEKQIKKAQEAGAFDNLKGKGKPMTHLNTDPLDEVLKAQGFKSRWAELEDEIRQKIAAAERAIQRSHTWALDRLSGGSADRMLAHDEWRKARELFRERVDEINRLIRTFNLVLPSQLMHLQRFPLNEQDTLRRLCPNSHESLGIS
jgi:hypothetical protein